jgi:hypothetical protein
VLTKKPTLHGEKEKETTTKKKKKEGSRKGDREGTVSRIAIAEVSLCYIFVYSKSEYTLESVSVSVRPSGRPFTR